MSKVIYSMSVSLDGYVETPDRGIEWTDPDDIALGAQLLLETMVRVANETP